VKRSVAVVVLTFNLFFLIFISNSHADLVSEGRALLFNNGSPTYAGLIAANQKFQEALAADSNNPEANLFYTVTRIGAFALEEGSGGGSETMRDVFEAFGMTRNGNIHLEDGLPYDTPSPLPGNSPGGETIRQFMVENYVPLLDGALANLAKIGDSFQTTLTSTETGDEAVEIDYGDVLMYQAALNLNKFVILMPASYNLDVDIDAAANGGGDLFKISADLLNTYPNFFKLTNTSPATLQSTREALLKTIGFYLDASAFIRAESDNQLNDLISLDPEDSSNEALLRQNLNELKASLIEGRTSDLTRDGEHLALNLNPFFGDGDGPYHLRDFLPKLDRCDHPIPGTVGHGIGNDPTLGGILPDFSQSDWGIEKEPCAVSMPWVPLLLLKE
jgi:hypothetical protein